MTKSKPITITAEDFQSWKENTITQAVMAHLKDAEQTIRHRWGEVLKSDITDPRHIQLVQVEMKAKLEFIDDITQLELSDIQEEDDAGPGN